MSYRRGIVPDVILSVRVCDGCGADISHRRPNSRWCGKECANHYHNGQRLVGPALGICHYCDKPLPTETRRSQKYCNPTCRLRHFRTGRDGAEQCKLDECDKPVDSDGLCRRHYDRKTRHGDPLAGRRSPGTAPSLCEDCGLRPPAYGRVVCGTCNRKRWTARDPERQRRMVNAQRRDWVARNRDKIAVQNRDYALRHPEKFLRYQQNRARLILEHPDRRIYGLAEWTALKNRFDNRCAYCGEKSERLEQDHVVPVSRGGRHAIANVLPACKPCNLSKSDLLLIEWRRELARR